MRYASVFLLAGFVGLAVFGVFGMHASMQDHGDCVATRASGIDCPKGANPIDFIVFHFDALRNFSVIVFGNNVTLFFVSLLLVLGIIFNDFLGDASLLRAGFSYREARRHDILHNQSRHALARWLAFHENSPTSF